MPPVIIPMAGDLPPFLMPVTALLLAAAVVGYLSVRSRVVPIVGFLLAGVLIGPHQLGLVADTGAVDAAAEIGVILLLFTIGIEFSVDRLMRVWRWIVVGGGAQVVMAIAVSGGLMALLGVGWKLALFSGFLVALSSTAIVLKMLADRGESGTTRGRLALSVLIFQDLAVVAMVLVVPLLGADAHGGAGPVVRALGTAALVIVLVLVVARRLMPPLLERVAALCSPEVFLLTVMAICFGTAFVTALAGVSVSLGAFLAGLVVSESRHSTHALAEVLPLQIIFSAVFFVSVGMLLDVRFLIAHLPLVLAAAAGVLVIKLLTTAAALLPLRIGWRPALATALLLGQVGEFSFVLVTAGEEAGLTPAGRGEDGAQAFVATTVLLMITTPVLAALGGRLDRMPRTTVESAPEHTEPADARDHVLLLGWGPDTVAVGQELQGRGLEVLMTTLNPDGAATAEAADIPVLRGDSIRRHVLLEAGIRYARMVVIAEDDPGRAAEVATVVRSLTTAPIAVRPRGPADLAELADAGVDHVVDPRLASRWRLFQIVLDRLAIPRAAVPAPGTGGRTWIDTSRLVDVVWPADSGCPHGAASVPVLPASAGCLPCLREDQAWVHLRICLGCGHVGCCDSSPGRHARAHHEQTDHPLMTSGEPGETWGYCFLDDTTVDLPTRPPGRHSPA